MLAMPMQCCHIDSACTTFSQQSTECLDQPWAICAGMFDAIISHAHAMLPSARRRHAPCLASIDRSVWAHLAPYARGESCCARTGTPAAAMRLASVPAPPAPVYALPSHSHVRARKTRALQQALL